MSQLKYISIYIMELKINICIRLEDKKFFESSGIHSLKKKKKSKIM